MQVHRIASQRGDGGFDHFVTFGDASPWDAAAEDAVQCATEADAIRLEAIVRSREMTIAFLIEELWIDAFSSALGYRPLCIVGERSAAESRSGGCMSCPASSPLHTTQAVDTTSG